MHNIADHHSLILIILLLGAAGAYIYGFNSGAMAFLILGGLLELAFWFGLLTTNERENET